MLKEIRSGIQKLRVLFWGGLILGFPFPSTMAIAAGPVLIAYGGFNETMAPLWVGVESGFMGEMRKRVPRSG
ncbi:MAG TPA: hypothetical protein VH985_00860 [Candidatus Binatia bacterium]|jgi:hypothetical protein